MFNFLAGSHSSSSEARGFGCDTDNQMLQTGALGMRGPQVLEVLGPPNDATELATERPQRTGRLQSLGREFLELVGRAPHESPSNIL